MAADTSSKELNLAIELMREVDQFMAALYRAQAIIGEKESAGIVWKATVFEGSELKHVEPGDMDTAASNVTGLLAYMVEGNIDDVFNKIRP